MSYKLVKVVVRKTEGYLIPIVPISEEDSVNSIYLPIIGYTMIRKDGGLTYYPREVAWELVSKEGSSNCKALTREYEGKTIKYLAPTDGIKVSERIIPHTSLPFE